MSYHCPGWVDSLDHIGVDGADIDELFADNMCNSFTESATARVNAEAEVQEYEQGDTFEAYCTDHDREVRWDRAIDNYDLLRDAGFFICGECDTVYGQEGWYDLHMAEDHEEEDEDDAPATYWPGVQSTHSGWAQHA